MTEKPYVGYKKLLAWQVADEFTWEVYRLTDKFPKSEIYGITSQTRRAALSVVLNIVEGHSRNNKKEFKHFLRIALGSLAEVEYLLRFCHKRNLITEREFEEVNKLR